uniref:Docking protein 2 n=1 Tax=Myripristis murdjan TaxID=586833 RepID=A0A667YF86_9TELE
MEEDIRKQGMVYLQQQRFGKKWKRVWCVLYRESSCSISRLEFFECKETGTLEKNDKTLRKQQEHKKVIRLADCIRVTEVEVDGCPRDTGPFLIETTEKIYVFAADRQQLDDWTHKLCEIAFPMSWAERGGKRASLHRGNRVDEDEGMEDNSLYSGRETVRDFRVCVRRTEASDRCRLKGVCVLRTDTEALLLLQPKSGEVVFSWPYRFLRRFGRDKSTFSFEAGRRCDSGEGSFEFDTKQGNVLFQAVEAAINLQRIAFPHRQTSGGGQDGPETPPPLSQNREKESCSPPLQQRHLQSRLEPPVDKALTGVKSLNLDTRGHPAPRKNQVKMISSCPLPHSGSDPDLSASPALNPRLSPKLSANEPEYSLPFDTIAKSVISDILKSHQALGLEGAESGADPLYDSIDESQIRAVLQGRAAGASRETYRKADHIYDEPEGCAAPAGQKPSVLPSVYDDPTEMKGNAWRIMGTVADPKGHEYPYNPRVDDYAVPKKPQREREEEEEEEEEEEGSPYDNVMVKTM